MTASGSLSGVTTMLSGGRSGMSSSATVIATVPKSAAICSSAPGSAAHSRPNGSHGRKCRRCQGTKARPHSAPSVMMAVGMNEVLARIRTRGAGQAPARPKAPGDLQETAGALAARILEARGLVDHQHVEDRVIIGKAGELGDQPGHEVDADHRHLARGAAARSSRRRSGPPSRTAMRRCRKVRPGRDLRRPYGRGDQLRRDDKSMPALPVADQLGQRRERSRTLAGTKRRDQQGGIALVEKVAARSGTNAGSGEGG